MLNPTPQKAAETPGQKPTEAATPSKRDAAATAAAAAVATIAPPAAPSKKKFQNGWTREIEQLLADWADKAVCYRWMHEKTERIYHSKDMAFMFPVIILSTITGAANFALDSVLSDPDHKKYAQLALGGMSIATGIISTIANRLAYASGSESHKGAAQLWGKFQRLIAIELRLHPNERSDCMQFLKMCRSELDRLIEQSPTIPNNVIEACKREFRQYPAVHLPEIIGDIDTTQIFEDKNSRLRELAKEAAIAIQQKKGVLKQIVLDDLEPRINRVMEYSTLPAIREELRKEVQRAAEKATREAVAAVAAGRVTASTVTATGGAVGGAGIGVPVTLSASTEKVVAARNEEVQRLAMSGMVRAMREKLASVNAKTGDAPPGIGTLFAGIPSSGLSEELVETDRFIHISDESLTALPAELVVKESTSNGPPTPFNTPATKPVAVATTPAVDEKK